MVRFLRNFFFLFWISKMCFFRFFNAALVSPFWVLLNGTSAATACYRSNSHIIGIIKAFLRVCRHPLSEKIGKRLEIWTLKKTQWTTWLLNQCGVYHKCKSCKSAKLYTQKPQWSVGFSERFLFIIDQSNNLQEVFGNCFDLKLPDEKKERKIIGLFIVGWATSLAT